MQKMPTPQKFLTVAEVAEILSVKDKTVRTWIKNGEIVASQLPNREWRLKPNAIEEMLKDRTTQKIA